MTRKSGSDSYWHMVNLFYHQLDGMSEGFLQKSHDDDADYPDFDVRLGTRLLNYLPDFFDYMEKFKLEQDGEDEQVLRRSPAKPSCSVLIKHLPEWEEMYVGHNTWHEYRAMGYRSG